MSHQDYINTLTKAISSYKGLTSTEKAYALKDIEKYIDKNGNTQSLIEKFEKININIKPFLESYDLNKH